MTPVSMMAAALFVLAAPAMAQPTVPAAHATDPVRMGWMTGAPVPADKQVRFDDASMYEFPRMRWSFSNWRALLPTVVVGRGGQPASPLPRALRTDLDSVVFKLDDGRTMNWQQAFDTNFTDGIVVLHQGRIVYERYAGALDEHGQHIAFSMTKSFVGTLAELLIHEGRIDPQRTMESYVPELADSGFGKATVRDVMDMRTAIQFDEDYAGGGEALTDVTRMALAAGLAPSPAGFSGPDGNFAFAASLGASGTHGGDFQYRTPNTAALQWVVERVGGAPLAHQLQQRIWAPMGMEQDAYLSVDRLGTAFGGGGMSAALRDFARFGEMIRLGGQWQGRQILPAAVVQAIRTPGDASAFAAASYPGLEGGSYRSQWWHRATGQTFAMGIHGQVIYVDPAAQMVIARFASHPVATNRAINPTSIPAYDAIARHLSGQR